MTMTEKKEVSNALYEEFIRGKTTCEIWQNSPNTFYRWAKNKIKTPLDTVVLINEKAPVVPWNIRIVTPTEEPKKTRKKRGA